MLRNTKADVAVTMHHSSKWGWDASIEPWLHVSSKLTEVVSELACLRYLPTNSFFVFLWNWVALNLKLHDNALVDFKVSNGEMVSTSDPFLSVALETGIEERDHLVEVGIK